MSYLVGHSWVHGYGKLGVLHSGVLAQKVNEWGYNCVFAELLGN